MKLFRYISLCILLLFGGGGYSQNQIFSIGSNLIKSGNSLVVHSGYDSDAQIFFDSLEANSVTLSYIQKASIHTLVGNLKSTGFWAKMNIIYPIIGGVAVAHSFNLKDPSVFQIIWVNSPTHSVLGVDYNGSQYGRTGLIPSVDRSGGISLSTYQRENVSNNGYSLGVISPNTRRTAYRTRGIGNISAVGANTNDIFGLTGSVTDSRGFFIGTKEGTLDLKSYRNGVIQATGTAISEQNPNREIYLSCYNLNGSPSAFTIIQSCFYSIGDRITATEAVTYYNIVQNYQTTNSRQIAP